MKKNVFRGVATASALARRHGLAARTAASTGSLLALVVACSPSADAPAVDELASASASLEVSVDMKVRCCEGGCSENIDCFNLELANRLAKAVAGCAEFLPPGKWLALKRLMSLGKLTRAKLVDFLRDAPECVSGFNDLFELQSLGAVSWISGNCSDSTCDGKDQNCSGYGRTVQDDGDGDPRHDQVCHVEPPRAFADLYTCREGTERCEAASWQCRLNDGTLHGTESGACHCSTEAPVYRADLQQCMSCEHADPAKPWWNPDTGQCEACPVATQLWDGDSCECPAGGPPLNQAGTACACEEGETWNPQASDGAGACESDCVYQEFTIDPQANCGCGGPNALSVGSLPPGEYTVDYVSGQVRTNSSTCWNCSYPGPCKGCGGESCWALYSNFGPVSFSTGAAFSVTVETPMLVWYQDNGCADNEGSITYAVRSAACL